MTVLAMRSSVGPTAWNRQRSELGTAARQYLNDLGETGGTRTGLLGGGKTRTGLLREEQLGAIQRVVFTGDIRHREPPYTCAWGRTSLGATFNKRRFGERPIRGCSARNGSA